MHTFIKSMCNLYILYEAYKSNKETGRREEAKERERERGLTKFNLNLLQLLLATSTRKAPNHHEGDKERGAND